MELGSGVPVEFDQRIHVRWLIGGGADNIMGSGRQEGGQGEKGHPELTRL